MATKILLNTTRIGSTVHNAGSAFDTVTEATTIARLGSAGGRLVDPTPAVVAAAALAVERRRKGEDVSSIDAMMAAAEGGGEGGGGGSINWRPDGTGDATTWAEVMAFLAGAGYGEATVLASQFGGVYSIPPSGTPYDMKGAVFKAPLGNAAGTIIDVADGAVLHDCQGVTGGTVLAFHCTAAPAMTFTDPGGGSPASFFVEEGAGIVNLGTAPVMAIPAGVPMVVAALRSGSVGEIGGPPQGPIVFAGVGSFVICASMLGSTWIDGWLVNDGVDPTANCVFQQDGSLRAPNPVNAGFAGSTFNVAFGNYGGSGPTAFRPSAVFGPLSVGVLYYDTDLGGLIVWNGAAWGAGGGGGGGGVVQDVFYIGPTGDDTTGDGSEAKPFKSMQKAYDTWFPSGTPTSWAEFDRKRVIRCLPGTVSADAGALAAASCNLVLEGFGEVGDITYDVLHEVMATWVDASANYEMNTLAVRGGGFGYNTSSADGLLRTGTIWISNYNTVAREVMLAVRDAQVAVKTQARLNPGAFNGPIYVNAYDAMFIYAESGAGVGDRAGNVPFTFAQAKNCIFRNQVNATKGSIGFADMNGCYFRRGFVGDPGIATMIGAGVFRGWEVTHLKYAFNLSTAPAQELQMDLPTWQYIVANAAPNWGACTVKLTDQPGGATGARPTAGRPVGLSYFDTTIGKPVWWTGAGWVDAAGAPA